MKLDVNSYILMTIYAIQAIVEMFLNTFLSAYIFGLTNNNVVPVSYFNIYAFAILAVIYFVWGNFMGKGRELLMYRTSFFIDAILFAALILLKEDSVRFIWILGIIWGVERATFYFPQNLISSVLVKHEQLIKYNGYQSALCALTKIVMPVFLGWFIDMDSFRNASIFIAFLIVIKLVLSAFLKYEPISASRFSLKKFVKSIKNMANVRYSLKIDLIRGFVTNSVDMLIVLYVVYIFKTNLNLGIFTSLFALCTVVSNAVLGKYLKYDFLKSFLIICGLLVCVSGIYFVIDPSKVTFIIYNFIIASAGYLVRTMTNINFYRVSQSSDEINNFRGEYIILREIFLSVGRVLGCGVVILGATCNGGESIKYLVMFFSLFIFIMAYMSAILAKNLSN